MAVIETWLQCDLKKPVQVKQLTGNLFSLDNDGNLIGVRVTNGGQPVSLSGTVTGYCILADGQTVVVTGDDTGIRNDDKAYIILPQLAYSVPGQISIIVKLTNGSTITTLGACTGYVYRSRTSNEVVPAGTPIPDLATMEEAIRRANTAASSANTAASSANTAATAAEKVNVAMSKTGKVITITATNRAGTSTSHTVTEPTLTVERANNVVTVTATDADGETSIEFDAVDADEVAELQEAVSTKAEEDGYYEELTAGSAEQLVSTEAVTDTTPYLYRKSGGSIDIGNRETLEKVIGGTVCWNQLLNTGKGDDIADWGGRNATIAQGSNCFELTANVESTDTGLQQNSGIKIYANHKYVIMADVKLPTSGSVSLSYSGGNQRITAVQTSNWTRVAVIWSYSTDISSGKIYILRKEKANVGDVMSVKNITSFDLTAMFGPTIADYVYSLEVATPGDGVNWFRNLFPKDYYEYNAGELISVKTTSHDMVGFNQWDEEVESGSYNTDGLPSTDATRIRTKNPIKVIGGASYYVKAPTTLGLRFYDANNTFIQDGYNKTIQNVMITAPTNAVYLRFSVVNRTTYNHDICINLYNSGSRNGEYEPYEKHSYPLADVELRGIVGIDADGKLVYSGDEYTPDGQVKRKYGIVDLGTLAWAKYDVAEGTMYRASVADIHTDAHVICAKYPTVLPSARTEKTIYKTTSLNVDIVDSTYTSATDFKTAMSGIMLVYELATPTTEQVAPYTPVQVVDDLGTEEFVDNREVAIPVGQSTSYMANLRDKLQHLPSLAEEDGEYIVKQTGTKMELSKLSSSGLAQSIFVETESAPVVSFADGADGMPMKAAKVAIEPVQDLHGYDAPWPAGGGANQWNEDWEAYGTSQIRSKTRVPVTAGATYFWCGTIVTAYEFENLTDSSIGNMTIQPNSQVTIPSGVNYLMIYSATGYGQTYLNNWALNYPATVTTYSPYSNVCPIPGHESVTVTRTGKNLLSYTPSKLSGSVLSLPLDKTRATIFKAGQTYKLSFGMQNATTWRICALVFDFDGNRIFDNVYFFGQNSLLKLNVTGKYYVWGQNLSVTEDSLTPKTDCLIMLFWLLGDTTDATIMVNPQIEVGSTATAYEPYQGQVYEVTFPTEAGTVYGGTLDVVRGKLVVDHRIIDLGSVNWNYLSSSSPYFYTGLSAYGAKNTESMDVKLNNYCSAYKPVKFYKFNDFCVAYYQNNVRIKDSRYTDAASFKTAVTGVTYCFELAQTIEIDLTTTEIKTLLGINNVWADAGDTSVTYPADTKLYIDKKIAELQALILENNG